MNKDLVLISGAIVYRAIRGKKRWFLARQSDESDEWEIPKIIARKAESSARAAMRLMMEQGGINTQVLEEAGRAGGSATINGKVVPQRHLYYIMLLKEIEEEEGEKKGGREEEEVKVIGFEESGWFEYAQAVRKLRSKRERLMLKQARQELKKWEKAEKNKEQ
ncbi:NUDIX domain-containing protein [Patescibacteria group bacterium]|nr:NUDIX domain-containing protein [Patescibacteria group bacterium]MBU0776676.1 NUDIX domain-containing protein [Patescibacteria group bacterium]MBU0846004.1 NUDIX domain-containing protein [Patescibacteria group bacterium]MBU0922496.1 NUDIX domain-containing protein [Patescibacteria group bacterium]MBU1066771.1 NUDIX domain-containing protein [Patescibacteria group bacterium]